MPVRVPPPAGKIYLKIFVGAQYFVPAMIERVQNIEPLQEHGQTHRFAYIFSVRKYD